MHFYVQVAEDHPLAVYNAQLWAVGLRTADDDYWGHCHANGRQWVECVAQYAGTSKRIQKRFEDFMCAVAGGKRLYVVEFETAATREKAWKARPLADLREWLTEDSATQLEFPFADRCGRRLRCKRATGT